MVSAGPCLPAASPPPPPREARIPPAPSPATPIVCRQPARGEAAGRCWPPRFSCARTCPDSVNTNAVNFESNARASKWWNEGLRPIAAASWPSRRSLLAGCLIFSFRSLR